LAARRTNDLRQNPRLAFTVFLASSQCLGTDRTRIRHWADPPDAEVSAALPWLRNTPTAKQKAPLHDDSHSGATIAVTDRPCTSRRSMKSASHKRHGLSSKKAASRYRFEDIQVHSPRKYHPIGVAPAVAGNAWRDS
jgi:hypothetical protein